MWDARWRPFGNNDVISTSGDFISSRFRPQRKTLLMYMYYIHCKFHCLSFRNTFEVREVGLRRLRGGGGGGGREKGGCSRRRPKNVCLDIDIHKHIRDDNEVNTDYRSQWSPVTQRAKQSQCPVTGSQDSACPLHSQANNMETSK